MCVYIYTHIHTLHEHIRTYTSEDMRHTHETFASLYVHISIQPHRWMLQCGETSSF